MTISESPYLRLIPACIKSHFRHVPDAMEDLSYPGYIGLRYGIKHMRKRRLGSMSIESYIYNQIRNMINRHIWQKLKNKKSPDYHKWVIEHHDGKEVKVRIKQYHHAEIEIGSPTPNTETNALVWRLLETTNLSERERQYLNLYYGMDGNGGMSLKAIGELSDISREAVRQVIEGALGKLRGKLGVEAG